MNSNIIYDVLTPPFLTPLFLRWILIRRDHGSRKKSNAGAKQSVHGTLHSEMPRTSQAKGMSSFSDVILGNNRRNSHSTLYLFQLRDMKCSIDNKCPRAASHLKTKAKKNALMEDRFAQIETENRLLLEKMSHIMRVSWYTCHLYMYDFSRPTNSFILSSSKGA